MERAQLHRRSRRNGQTRFSLFLRQCQCLLIMRDGLVVGVHALSVLARLQPVLDRFIDLACFGEVLSQSGRKLIHLSGLLRDLFDHLAQHGDAGVDAADRSVRPATLKESTREQRQM